MSSSGSSGPQDSKKKKGAKQLQAPLRSASATAGSGALLLAAAGLAGFLLWRRLRPGTGDGNGPQGGTAGGASSSRAGAGQGRSGNRKKDKTARRAKKEEREAKRNAHLEKQDKHKDAPDEQAVVQDEKKGIHGDHLYLNYSHFTGTKKK